MWKTPKFECFWYKNDERMRPNDMQDKFVCTSHALSRPITLQHGRDGTKCACVLCNMIQQETVMSLSGQWRDNI
jgi:hypothetical protein